MIKERRKKEEKKEKEEDGSWLSFSFWPARCPPNVN